MKGWSDSANSPLRMAGIGISLPIQIQSSFKPRSRATISTPFLNQRTLVLLSFFELCSVSLGHLRSRFYISTFLLFFSECIICSLLVCNFCEKEVITLLTDGNLSINICLLSSHSPLMLCHLKAQMKLFNS